ncbi:MAG: CheY-P-specific phosphatase CheC [Clostridiales Family XIII bacterium]|nr:CheY-P-specific phosphatase CheC [Clostridiales Family XIII bacterium]HOA42265.1 chemotaxis protein CheC [Bacillota bacterium]HPZ60144.1 chemotaxis protein CheC [Bacillota bacterium]HQC82210.1 chemotaxis protein CheC [Bacillota bacterium]
MLKNYEELNEVHIDVLREIGNIGAGNAATALASILDERVEMSLPVVRITDFDTAINALGGAEAMTVGVLVNFYGEANGMIMFLMKMEDAQKILSILLQGFDTEEESEEMTELKLSAIKEIGNILGSSYINAIATLTGLQINLSVPYIAIDMAGAIMSVPIIEFGSVGDKIMFIEEVFSGRENDLRSNVIMFAQIETLKLIMERLGLNL